MKDEKDPHAELMAMAIRYFSKEDLEKFDAYARTLTDRITELEAQLEAVGAGGVGAMLVKPAPAVAEPAYWLTENGDLFSKAEFAAMYAPGRKLTPLYMHPAPQPQQIAEPASQWVSADERLPGEQGQDSEEVLCFLSGHCAITDFECRDGAGWGIRLGYYDAERGMFRTHGRPDSGVTHWMSLPPPPATPKEQS